MNDRVPHTRLQKMSIHALRGKLIRARKERGTLPNDSSGRRRALRRIEQRIIDELHRRGLDP